MQLTTVFRLCRCFIAPIMLTSLSLTVPGDDGKVIGDDGKSPHALASVATKVLNSPPEGFTALFSGRDLTGWRVNPKVRAMWSIEDGVLKAPNLLEEWGADLETEKKYQDFVLQADFRMPTKSDSGIFFRGLIPDMGNFGQSELFKIRSNNGMGSLLSFQLMPENVKNSLELKSQDLPQIKPVHPAIKVWHTVKLTVIGTRLVAELDGDRILDFQYPKGYLAIEPASIRFQKHRFVEGANPGERNPCPIEFRNIFIKEIKPSESGEARGLNVPPEGFTALFNGKDLTGWHTRPEVSENWVVEDGVLKSTTLVEHYRASLLTKQRYRDFILMLEFRMPTISDSGICFRQLIPEIPGFGTKEQFNLRSRGGMGHLESYYFLPKETAEKVGLKEDEKPHVRHIDPEVGVWHKVKLTMKGRTFSAEYDGEVLHDRFQFHDWMMDMEPASILLQKHMVVRGDNLGEENPCPIEYRNVFIKELGPDDTVSAPSPSRGEGQAKLPAMKSLNAELLARIDAGELPEGYVPAKHQEYVDQHWPELSPEQVARALELWKLKQKIDPDMPNRGFSFVKIMTNAAKGQARPAEHEGEPKPDRPAPENKATKPVNKWKWSAEGARRKAIPIKISDERTIYVAAIAVSEDDKPPVVLLPESRLSVSGRLATDCPVYFGITINHPNGDFAGRFVTERSTDEYGNDEEFQATLALQDFQLDSSLAEMKDKLPGMPFHFVIESIWLHTLEEQAGLEIAEVRLEPRKTQNTRKP